MPSQKRHKTKYQGVYYIEGKAIGSNKTEKIYYIMYRKNGKQIHEKAGRQYQDDMTPSRAAQKRILRIQGDDISNKERRFIEKQKKTKEVEKWTLNKLSTLYFEDRGNKNSKKIDKLRFEKYLKSPFGLKEPSELIPLDIDRLRINLLKKLSPQSVKHVLNLLTWIINYGVKKNLCSGIPFHITKPSVNNQKTEDLNAEQVKALLKAINEHSNVQIKNLMLLALYTGMRRGELFNLKWEHIDFERGFINIVDPKGGVDQKIPLNDAALKILKSHTRPNFKVKESDAHFIQSPYVFPGQNGTRRASAQAGVNEIKKKAGLPKDFRPLHGLRHVYASMLASSGQVDMYTLQKLLTHKDPRMTQRYAHLRDDALKNAANLAGELISEIKTAENTENELNNNDGAASIESNKSITKSDS